MRIIGLTGGIACGKSHVSQVLESLGAVIIDGDRISRLLTENDGAALPDIRRKFGSHVFNEDGSLNRKKLGEIVFSSDEMRHALNGIIHPLVISETKRRIEEEEKRGTRICVLDMPLLFECRMESLCNTVWCVVLPEDLQLQRLCERDGLTREEAEKRIRSQMSTREKIKKSEIIIDTSGTLEYTRDKVIALYMREIAKAG